MITAYLTKNNAGNVELWKHKPKYNSALDEWLSPLPNEVGSEILDKLLNRLVQKGECVIVSIAKIG